jgi:60 kDa SS-A/Ro ribonucleoprotein
VTTDPLRAVTTRATPQFLAADPRQVPNNAGGYSFALTPVQRLRRFLVLGTARGTYHVAERELTLDNAQVVLDIASTDHRALVDVTVEVSESGRAPRPEPALFALAVAASEGTADERNHALAQLPRVARTGTHLFTFVTYVRQFRGWGPTLRRGVAAWYLDRPVERVAYQAVKYRQRDGWTHRDVLRLAHPAARETDHRRRWLFDWMVGRGEDLVAGFGDERLPADDPLRLVEGYERVRRVTGGREAAELVREYRLPWEALPDEVINRPEVWEALLDVDAVPATALLRQLPRLTRLGLLPDLEGRGVGVTAEVVRRLTDPERLRRGRVHPLQVLVALRTYASGRSDRGSSRWTPSRRVVDALDAAFYVAFGAVTPSGRRTLLALDVSGSMTQSTVAGTPLTPREASAALALVTLSVEPSCQVLGFTGSGSGHRTWSGQELRHTPAVAPLDLSARRRLDDVLRYVGGLPFGRTDCALPVLYALEHGLEVDTFVLYTDSETYAGPVHPHEALRRYRERVVHDARFVVVGMTATELTVADPADPLSLDVVGFDTATPGLLADFARGEL